MPLGLRLDITDDHDDGTSDDDDDDDWEGRGVRGWGDGVGGVPAAIVSLPSPTNQFTTCAEFPQEFFRYCGRFNVCC